LPSTKPFQLILTRALLLAPDGRSVYPGDLGVRNGRIAALTPPGGLKDERSDRMLDIQDMLVIPGFWDSHLHLAESARALLEINLRYCTDPLDFARLLREADKAAEPGAFLLGQGWEEDRVLRGETPTRTALDRICADRCVALFRLDGHSVWLNTRAVEELGVGKLSFPPSLLPRGEDGTPVGILYEKAVISILSMVQRHLPPGYQRRAIREAARAFNAAGITSVNDICTGYPANQWLYRKMQRGGELPLRVTTGSYGPSFLSRLAFCALRACNTEHLRVGPDKYYLDGGFGSRTAALREPFADQPGNHGLLTYSDGELTQIVRRSLRWHKHASLHVIGDRALEQLLTVYERLGSRPALRHRVEHLQYTTLDDLNRFKNLGFIASMQPVFLHERDLTLACLGRERMQGAYRFGSFLAAGIPMLFNTDFPFGGGRYPVKPNGSPYQGFEPLLGLHAAATLHHLPTERITAADALRAYTATPAWANFAEDELGSLKEGYRADLAVLDRSILERPPEELLETRVLLTVLGGRVVHEGG